MQLVEVRLAHALPRALARAVEAVPRAAHGPVAEDDGAAPQRRRDPQARLDRPAHGALHVARAPLGPVVPIVKD